MGGRFSSHKVRTIRVATPSALNRWCRAGVVGLVSVVMIATPLAFGGTVPWVLALLEGAVWLALACWLMTMLLTDKVELVSCPVVAPVITVASYAVVRYTMCEIESLARQEMMLVLTEAVLFVLVLNTMQRRSQVTWLVVCWACLGMVLAGWGSWQWSSGSGSIWGWPRADLYAGRASGSFLRPSHYAAYLGMLFAICGGFFLFSRWRHRTKVWLAFVCVALSAGVLLAYSVAGWAGWLAATLILGAYAVRRRGFRLRWLLIGAVLWTALVVAALIGLQGRRLSENELPWWSLWEAAAHIGTRNVLFGAGPGMFRWLYPSERVFQGQVLYASNEYLNLFADYGLTGVVLVAWLLASFVHSSVRIIEARARRYSVDTLSNRYAIVAAGLAALAAGAVQAIFDFNLHVPAIALSLTVLMGLVLTCGVHPSGQYHDDDSVIGSFTTINVKGAARWLLIAGVLVGLGVQGWGLIRTGPAEWYRWRGQRRQAQLDWAGAQQDLALAWRFDYRNSDLAEAMGDLYLARATWRRETATALRKKALTWYDRAYVRNPYEWDVLVKIARLFDADGQREKAADRLQRALQADPRNASYHAQLGLHYQRWGDPENASACFRRAYELGGTDRLPEIELKQLGEP